MDTISSRIGAAFTLREFNLDYEFHPFDLAELVVRRVAGVADP